MIAATVPFQGLATFIVVDTRYELPGRSEIVGVGSGARRVVVQAFIVPPLG